MYGCNEPDENASQQSRLPEDTEMQQVALDGTREIILFRMPLLSQTLIMRTDLASPLICYSLYHAASECAWFLKEDRTDEIITVMKTYIDLLMALEKRWKVAGESPHSNHYIQRKLKLPQHYTLGFWSLRIHCKSGTAF